MRKNRSISYREIADAAKAKGLKKIFPISFGRAQLTLGIVRKKKGKAARPAAEAMPAKRGPGRPRKAEATVAAPVRRGPGRPRKNAAVGSTDILANLNGIVEQLTAMRTALSEIANIARSF